MSRRVEPEAAAHTDDEETEMGDLVIDMKPEPHDETEMGDLVINVKPKPHLWPLWAAGLQRRSPKEVPAQGSLEGAPCSSPILVPATVGPVLTLGLQNQPAPWMSLVPDSHDRQPWTDRHPDTLTCGLCQQTFPLTAIVTFMDHKTQGCPPSRGPSPGPDSEQENPKVLTCLHCGQQFTTAWKLLRHAQWDHGLSIYRTGSEAPETPLLGLAEVAAAMSAVAGQEVEAEGSRAHSLLRRSPTCPVCRKTLSTFSSLKVHMRSHTGERPYACDQCPFACAQSSKLNRHKKTHQRLQPQSPYTAKARGEQASAAGASAPARTLLCSREGAGAAEAAGAQEPGARGDAAQAGPGGDGGGGVAIKEERINSAQIPEKLPKKTPMTVGKSHGPRGNCEFCGKRFTHRGNLTVHRRSHTGERPYTCDLCSYACAQSSKLNRHRGIHRLGPGGARFECPHCGVPFGLRATLDKHLRQKHPQAGWAA